MYAVGATGSKQRVFDFPILHFQSVSPTGKWAAVLAVVDGAVSTAMLGVDKEPFRWVRAGYWASRCAVAEQHLPDPAAPLGRIFAAASAPPVRNPNASFAPLNGAWIASTM